MALKQSSHIQGTSGVKCNSFTKSSDTKCVVYLDYLLVHTKMFKKAMGLLVNLKKCTLFKRKVAFLGHVVRE